jgi:hypothetical protein
MPKFDICLHISGIVSRTVEAQTLEEAEEIARADVYNSDWNEMACPEVEVLDYEEVE